MLQTLVPIATLFIAGIVLKVTGFVSQNVIAGMKKIAANVFLTPVVFNAMLTANYSRESLYIFLSSLFIIAGAFFVGLLLKKVTKKDKEYRDYKPCMMTTFECGMLGYTLIETLLGKGSLGTAATIDLAGAIFTFTVVLTVLERISRKAEGEEVSNDAKKIVLSMLKSPTLIAALLGFVLGITGVGKLLLESQASEVYGKTIELLTTSLTPVILICLGYGISISKASLKDALIVVAERILTVAALCAISYMIFKNCMEYSKEVSLSYLLYFSLPPSFLFTAYARGKKTEEVISCVLSIYTILTLLVFAVLLACTN